MWLNCTCTKVDPGEVGRVVKILSSDASLAPIRAARGFRGMLLVESTETPGEITSITWWESAEEGQAYLASPENRRVIEGIRDYLVKPLERNYYDVHLITAPKNLYSEDERR
jgi:heme-degrading monooxygenase HmoA